MGPFYEGYNNNWYGDYSHFVESSLSWFIRGGGVGHGVNAGQFYFGRVAGEGRAYAGARLVLLG